MFTLKLINYGLNTVKNFSISDKINPDNLLNYPTKYCNNHCSKLNCINGLECGEKITKD